MRSPEEYAPVSVETRRIPLLRKVFLAFEGETVLKEGLGINISMMGMFVRTEFPRRVGASARFSLTLADGQEPIEGSAEVMWIRTEEEGEYLPPGMGMKFLRVSGEGRSRIREAVERLVEETSAPAELRDLRMVVEETLEGIFAARDQEAAEETGDPAAANLLGTGSGTAVSPSALEPERRGRRRLWLLLSLPVALVLTAALSLWSSRSSSPLPAGAPGPSPSSAGGSRGGGAPAMAAVKPSGPPLAQAASAATEQDLNGAEDLAAQVRSTLTAWAAAWSQQRAEDYLSHYVAEYRPPGDLSREEWISQRRQRLTTPDFIQVSIVDLEIRIREPDRAEAEFLQSYRSDRYRDSVRKTLHLVHRDGRWLILQERGRTGSYSPNS